MLYSSTASTESFEAQNNKLGSHKALRSHRPVWHGDVTAATIHVFFADAAPGATVALQQFVGFGWSPRTGGVIGEAAGR